MAKKIFSRNPLIWFHYVLLLAIIYASYYVGDFLFATNFVNLWIMLPWFYVWISVGDQLIHFILGVD